MARRKKTPEERAAEKARRLAEKEAEAFREEIEWCINSNLYHAQHAGRSCLPGPPLDAGNSWDDLVRRLEESCCS